MSSCSRTCRRAPSTARSASRARRRAALEIGSVDSRRVFVARTDDAIAATERKRVEDAIEKLKDDRAVLLTAVQAAEMQKTLIGNLAQLPTRPAPANGAAPPQPDWGQLFGLIGERLAEAQKTILDTQIKVRAVDRQIKDLEGKLASLAPAQEERTEVKVFVHAGGALEAEMAIRYQVGGASWLPFYDARLATGTKAQAPKLQLVRRASIQQRTGESWDEVALALSTARPGAGTAAPELQPMTIDYEPDAPPPRPVSAPPVGASRSMSREAAAPAGGRADEDAGQLRAKSARRSPSRPRKSAPRSRRRPSRPSTPSPAASRCPRPGRPSACRSTSPSSIRRSPCAPCPSATRRPSCTPR